jgi:hypothetical protein
MTWPTDVDTNDELLIALNNWWTTLPAGISNGDTTFSISNGDQLQDTQGVLSIEDEVIYYATLTRTPYSAVLGGVIRGYDGTIARPHVAGTRVELRWVAKHHNGLVQRIRVLETFIGPLINEDPLNGGTFDNLADRLNGSLPLTVAATGATWTIPHDRRRLVGVQLWREIAPGQFDKTDAPITQTVNPGGTSTVVVEFGDAVNGYAILF